MTFIIFVLIIFLLLYVLIKRKQTYWQRLGVPYVEPTFFYGNSKGIDKTIHHSEIWRNHYFKLKDKGPLVGFYLYTEPIAMITDPDLIKRIYVTDFDYFVNRGFYINEKDDPSTATIYSIKDERWSNLRDKIQTLFTEDRLKGYFDKITTLADLFLERLEIEGFPELRQIASRYVVDTLGSIYFNVEFGQLKDQKYDMVSRINGPVRGITYTSKTIGEIYQWFLANILHVKVMPNETAAFWKSTFKAISEQQKANSEDNLIDRLNYLYKNKFIKIDEIWSNSAVFLMGGHDNTSSVLRHTLYELSKRKDLQIRCRDSIKAVLSKHNINSEKDITYEAISEMTFVDQCLQETLRLYTAPIFTGRIVKYDYKVPKTNITLPKGTLVHSAICGIQFDSKYFPNPNVWDPDRMSPSNIQNMPECVLLPFGIGPHQCLGLKLAPLIAKTAIVKTVLKYELELNYEKTPETLKLNPKIFRVTSEGMNDIYLRFNKIKE